MWKWLFENVTSEETWHHVMADAIWGSMAAVISLIAVCGRLVFGSWRGIFAWLGALDTLPRWGALTGPLGYVGILLWRTVSTTPANRLADGSGVSHSGSANISGGVPDPKMLDVQFHYPTPGANVDSTVDVMGIAKVPIPDGYSLRILRGYPKLGGVLPVGHLSLDSGTGKWEVRAFEVGGDPGIHDLRTIEIWLVGKDGEALLKCWSDAHLVHRKAMEKIKELTGKYGEWLGPIQQHTEDMLLCAKIEVYRK